MSVEVNRSQPQSLETAYPTTSSRMEQVVTHLATSHNIDLSQNGATLTLAGPDQRHHWLITNVDNRIGITRLNVEEANGLTPDLDIVLEQQPTGWEPVEVMHSDAAWRDYAKVIEPTEQGDFSFATFADAVAEDLAQQAPTATVAPGLLFERRQQPETNSPPIMVSVAEAAQLVGLTPHGINHLIKRGHAQTETRKITEVVERQRTITFVSLADVQHYREHNGKSGRPKKHNRS